MQLRHREDYQLVCMAEANSDKEISATLSVVTPAFCESKNLEVMHDRLRATLDTADIRYLIENSTFHPYVTRGGSEVRAARTTSAGSQVQRCSTRRRSPSTLIGLKIIVSGCGAMF